MAPKNSAPILRDTLQTTSLLMPDAASQLELKVADKDSNGYLRELPDNEVLVMALNESAAAQGRGFYYYLPFREAWKKHDSVDLLPKSRVPIAPGSRYPDILYVHFIWSQADKTRFAGDTQRARYLKCNALANPLHDDTPLYAMQYVGYSSCPTYTTPDESLVIFATKVPSATYYLCTTTQLRTILKPWNKRWLASGPEPEARLNQPPEMWKRQSGPVPTPLRELDPFKLPSPQSLHQEITRRCTPVVGDIPSSFTARELRNIVPRPTQPEPGVKLGSAIPDASPAKVKETQDIGAEQ